MKRETNPSKRICFFRLSMELLPWYCNNMYLPTQTPTLWNVCVNTFSSAKESFPLGLLRVWVSVLPVTCHFPWNVHRHDSSPSVQKKNYNTARIRMGFSYLPLPVYHYWLQSSPPQGSLPQLFKEPHPWHALLVDCKRLNWHKQKYRVNKNREKSESRWSLKQKREKDNKHF